MYVCVCVCVSTFEDEEQTVYLKTQFIPRSKHFSSQL